MEQPPARKDRFLEWPDVRALIPVSRQTIWRMERRHRFPKRVRMTTGRVAWRASEIDDYIAGRWKPKADAT